MYVSNDTHTKTNISFLFQKMVRSKKKQASEASGEENQPPAANPVPQQGPFVPSNMSPQDWVNMFLAMQQVTGSSTATSTASTAKDHQISDDDEGESSSKKARKSPEFNTDELTSGGKFDRIILQAAEKKESMNKKGVELPSNFAAFLSFTFEEQRTGVQIKELCERYPGPPL